MDAERQIQEIIRESNLAWTNGAPERTAALFGSDAVIVSPSLELLAEGRDAIVKSYVDYCTHAATHEFEESHHTIRVFGDTAVATYRFKVSYSVGGNRHDEVGQEVLVLRNVDGCWCAVWRVQLPSS